MVIADYEVILAMQSCPDEPRPGTDTGCTAQYLLLHKGPMYYVVVGVY